MSINISQKVFGKTCQGEDVIEYTVKNSSGSYISLISYGAAIRCACVPDKNGTLRDVVLGYDTVSDYEKEDYFFGATIGRVANRIEDAHFTLNNKEYSLVVNNGTRNCLHGGNYGFDKRNWIGEIAGNSVIFHRVSPDGEENFPGNLSVKVTYSFTEENEIIVDYEAVSDADTIVNMTNHTYFNLSGHDSGSIEYHTLQIEADQFAQSNDECLATGNIINVAGTSFDFRTSKVLGTVFDDLDSQQKLVGGYDHSFLIRGYNGMVRKAAQAVSPYSGIALSVYTNKPSVHFYSGNFMKKMPSKGGRGYDYRGGLCLETQYLPNAMKNQNFPSIILHAGDMYLFRTKYCFSVKR